MTNLPTIKAIKIQIVAILLFHHLNTIGEFVKKKLLGGLGRSSCTVKNVTVYLSICTLIFRFWVILA